MSSSSLNKVILLGRLGKDPEISYTTSGFAFTKASLATTNVYKDKDGNKQEQVEWHKLVFSGKLAEICKEFLKKGSHVYVEGKIRTDKWKNKQGQDQYSTSIHCAELKMLDKNHSTINQYNDITTKDPYYPPASDERITCVGDDDIPF